jgi:Helix-hairpin-helix motif
MIARGLLPYEEQDASFFLDMLPGPRGPDGLPECIEFWKSRIEGLGGEDCFRVGVLFGPSGCGKTSLVRAGLLPVLSECISVVHIEATADGTEDALLRQLRNRCADLSEGVGLASALIATRKGLTLAPGKKVLVILDQFERWLRGARVGEEQGLVAALRQCDGERLQAIVVVRDDAWSGASRFMRDLGDRLVEGGNAAAVDPFDRRHARKVLAACGRAYGTLPADQASLSEDQEKFLDGAIAALDGGQLIMPARLALFIEMVKSRAWSPQTLEDVSGLGDVSAVFLERAFHPEAAPPEPSDRAALVNINTATPEELRSLPGVGAAIAHRIIEGRPYQRSDALLKVKGIGDKNLREMRPFIKLR